MLFLVPLGIVPLLVAAGMVLGSTPEYLTGDRHPSRALAAAGNAWHSIGPVLVLAAFDVTAPNLSELAGAPGRPGRPDRGGQRLCDAPRVGGRSGLSPKLQPSLLGWSTLVHIPAVAGGSPHRDGGRPSSRTPCS